MTQRTNIGRCCLMETPRMNDHRTTTQRLARNAAAALAMLFDVWLGAMIVTWII